MEPHLSSLQDIVRLTIRQELEWSERRFKRITMSEDASDNPAELYGADGKIYYRKAGVAGVEIDAGGSLWASSGTKTGLITPEPVKLEDNLEFDGDHIIKWFEESTSNLVGSVYGFQGAVQRDFMVKSHNSGILTLDSAAGYIACSGDRLSDVGTPVDGGDAANKTYVDGAGGAYLPLAGGIMSGGIDIAGYFMDNVFTVQAFSNNGIVIQDDGGTIRAYLAHSGDSCHRFSWPIDMNDNAITAVGGITMHDATSPIDMAGSTIDNLSRIDAYAASGIIVYDKDGFQIFQFEASGTIECNLPLNMDDNNITAVGGITMYDATSPIDMAGSTIDNLSRIDAYAASGIIVYDKDGFQIFQFEASGTIECNLPLNMDDNNITAVGGITMYDATSPIDMNESDIYNANVIRLHEVGLVGPYMMDGMFIKSQSGVFTLASFSSTDDTSGSLELGVSLDMGGHTIFDIGSVRLKTASELTIAAGVITIIQKYHKIDTESDGATDDLVTINGGDEGEELIIRAMNSARTVVVKNGTGNILLEADRTLNNVADTLSLIYDGANWLETGFANNGA